MTEVKAEVPMAEMVTYAPDLRALTGGRGEYTMEFLRYEEVPAHLAQKVVQEAQRGDGCRVAPPSVHGAIASDVDDAQGDHDVPCRRSCEVCGRTLLRGEEAEPFIAGGTAGSCATCARRVPPTRAGSARAPRTRRASTATVASAAARSLLRRLRERTSRPELPPLDDDLRPRTRPSRSPSTSPRHHRLRPPPPGRDEPRGSLRASSAASTPSPTHADLKRSRAVELFNGSRHRRTVAGVARSLGDPLVAVRPSATEGSIVSIVVGWELSWYRYEVDLADEEAGVRLVAQGAELTELEARTRRPTRSRTSVGRSRSRSDLPEPSRMDDARGTLAPLEFGSVGGPSPSPS